MRKKIKVLAICAKGLNRSKYLASYLRTKGYSTRSGGLEENEGKREKTRFVRKEDVRWADIIIIVRKRLKRIFDKKFGRVNKKFIILDVTDSRRLIPEEFNHLKKLDYHKFQLKWTYPNLRKAIKSHLPLKKR